MVVADNSDKSLTKVAAPRLREQADPPSTADRLPAGVRRGLVCSARALVALTGAPALPATAEAQDPPGQPDPLIEAIFWVSSEVVVYPETDTGPRDRAVATTPRRMAVSQRLGVDAISRYVVCIALVVATLTACVQTQDEHSPAAQALADLRASAEAGDAEAQFILGGMYVTGVGVPQDAAEAVAWYRRAAEQGDARAQYNLGGMYRKGRGVPQDAAGAVAWYRRAAEQGHARAQYNLGGMYRQGRGVPQDAAEAHMWLTIAASRSTGAERELIVTARAAVAARMTPPDLREAERRAQAWHAAHQGMRNRAAPPSDTGREGLIIALGLLVAL